MKRIFFLTLFISALSYAGTTNPASNYQWKAGCSVTLDSGDITLTNGDITLSNGGITLTGKVGVDIPRPLKK